jgi:hypothetical protein
MLLTDAAHQLQAVAGVWPVSADEAVKARWEQVLRECPQPGCLAEQRAFITQQLLVCVIVICKEIPSNSDAACLRAAEHSVLARWQYLSAVLQDSPMSQRSGDSSTIQRFIAPTVSQKMLANSATGPAVTGTVAGMEALAKAKASAGSSSSMHRTPGPAAPTVFNRHHVECVALCMVLLQLTLQTTADQEQVAVLDLTHVQAAVEPTQAQQCSSREVGASLHLCTGCCSSWASTVALHCGC